MRVLLSTCRPAAGQRPVVADEDADRGRERGARLGEGRGWGRWPAPGRRGRRTARPPSRRPCGRRGRWSKTPVSMPVGDDRRPRWSRGPRRGRPRPWRAPASRMQSRSSSCQSSHSCASRSSLGRHRSRKAESRCGRRRRRRCRSSCWLSTLESRVGVGQHLGEELLLGVEVVVQQARRHPGRPARCRPSGPSPGRRGRCTRRPRPGSGCGPRRRPGRAGWGSSRSAAVCRPERCWSSVVPSRSRSANVLTVQSVSDARLAPMRRQGSQDASGPRVETALATAAGQPLEALFDPSLDRGRRRQRRPAEVGPHPRPAGRSSPAATGRCAGQPRGARGARPPDLPHAWRRRAAARRPRSTWWWSACPSAGLVDAVRDAVEAGARTLVVITAGLSEPGADGRPDGAGGAADRPGGRRRAGRAELHRPGRHRHRPPAQPRRAAGRRRDGAQPERQHRARPGRAARGPGPGRRRGSSRSATRPT